jgi:hypothetical protein
LSCPRETKRTARQTWWELQIKWESRSTDYLILRLVLSVKLADIVLNIGEVPKTNLRWSIFVSEANCSKNEIWQGIWGEKKDGQNEIDWGRRSPCLRKWNILKWHEAVWWHQVLETTSVVSLRFCTNDGQNTGRMDCLLLACLSHECGNFTRFQHRANKSRTRKPASWSSRKLVWV